jgi:hypothetical protein
MFPTAPLAFESFHIQWERLMRQLFQGETKTLAEYYRKPVDCEIFKMGNFRFCLEPKTIHIISGSVPFHEVTIDPKWQTNLDNLCRCAYVPGTSNPGFDSITFEKSVADPAYGNTAQHQQQFFALCFQNRFSDPKAKTSLTVQEIIHAKKQSIQGNE